MFYEKEKCDNMLHIFKGSLGINIKNNTDKDNTAILMDKWFESEISINIYDFSYSALSKYIAFTTLK